MDPLLRLALLAAGYADRLRGEVRDRPVEPCLRERGVTVCEWPG